MSCRPQGGDPAELKAKAGRSHIPELGLGARTGQACPSLQEGNPHGPEAREVKPFWAEAVAAAPESILQALCEESRCSICLDYFRDPVSIAECGHNFCRACLSQSGGESDAQASCPQCRGTFQKSNLRPNRQLARIVEIARVLSGQGVRGAEGKGRACEKHQEPLKLFCRDHEAPICLVCDKAKEHKDHQVVPLEEASEEYQDLLQRRLESLREERGRILARKAEAEREKQALLKQMETEREETVAQFRRMHQFLEEQEKRLLAQVDELQEEIARKAEDHLAWLSKELSSLEGIMREVEEKSQQPAAELLQDVRSTLRRSEKEPCEIPAAFPLELKWRIWDFSDRKPDLEGWRKQFPGVMSECKAANVTLDPETAHPRLLLSQDHKSVRIGDKRKNVPDNPKRFSYYTFVVGHGGFTAGRHSWEVRVGSEGAWAVGVARGSVNRKRASAFSPKEGFWLLWYFQGIYKACTNPYSALPVSGEPKTIRVSLNCDGGRVAFYDADRGTLLYAFSRVSFAGETLFPFFHVSSNALLTITS